MSLIARLTGRAPAGAGYRALYDAIVAEARDPGWYRAGGVADTREGRFEMVAGVLGLVLLRLEREGGAGREPAARLTEVFVRDMDGQLREDGIGDLVVGKRIGLMMGALGGRLGAYRDGLAPGGDLAAALARNLHRGEPVGPGALAHGEARFRALAARLAAIPAARLLAGDIG